MLSNGILETTTTTGTGDLTTSAVTGRPRFTDKWTANATEASAGHFYYAILTQDSPPQFLESGIGWMSAAGTLKRQVVLSTYASSTYTDVSATAATLPSGTKNVICTGECGSAGGLAMPGIDISVGGGAYKRHLYTAHSPLTQMGGTLTLTANRLYFQPFLLLSARTVDALFFRNSSGTGNARIALFEMNRNGLPGRMIMGSTADQATAAGTVYSITDGGPVRLAPGWYYTAFVCDAANVLNCQTVAGGVIASPFGWDGTSKPVAYAYLANGSTTMANPASAPTAPVTADSVLLGLGVRVVA